MPLPGIVFHYTNSEALPNIVNSDESTSLRATGIRYLNDQSELDQGINTVLELLENNPDSLELEDWLIDSLRVNFKENTLSRMDGRYFVACFSSATDLVDQWRGYGENGLGFSLGYNADDIEKHFQSYENVSAYTCLYEIEEQQAELVNSCNRVKRMFYHLRESDRPGYREGEGSAIFEGWVSNELQKHILRIKHRAYKQEQEYRLVIDPFDMEFKLEDRLCLKLEFRSSKRGLIPYVTLNMPIPRVILVGPSEHQEENFRAAKMLLDSVGLSGTGIILDKESMPFRG